MVATHTPHSSPSSSHWLRKDCIGRGSFGRVHLAVESSTHEIFAVKSVNTLTSPPSHLEALENEIEILRSLSSPYIVEYLGADLTRESRSEVYRNLHMEYVPGGTAAEVAYFSDQETVRGYTRCIVSALQYLHSQGIVHCDVKGQNVLIEDGYRFAKLADFGNAKRAIEDDYGINNIVARGTPLWMAPEVIRGEKQGTESDVWSLGCTLIEMITGKPAWNDDDSSILFRIGFWDELPEFPSELSELGWDFLEKCLRREPGERWTCDQLLEHPFVSNVEVYSSPRSVLSWTNCEEYSQPEQDQEVTGSIRIGGLGSGRGAIWESNGWEEVRNVEEIIQEQEEVMEYSKWSEGEREGAKWEIEWESERVEVEMEKGELEYSIVASGGWREGRSGKCCSGAGSGCQDGSIKKKNSVVVNRNNCCRCFVCCCSSIVLSVFKRLMKYRALVA